MRFLTVSCLITVQPSNWVTLTQTSSAALTTSGAEYLMKPASIFFKRSLRRKPMMKSARNSVPSRTNLKSGATLKQQLLRFSNLKPAAIPNKLHYSKSMSKLMLINSYKHIKLRKKKHLSALNKKSLTKLNASKPRSWPKKKLSKPPGSETGTQMLALVSWWARASNRQSLEQLWLFQKTITILPWCSMLNLLPPLSMRSTQRLPRQFALH